MAVWLRFETTAFSNDTHDPVIAMLFGYALKLQHSQTSLRIVQVNRRFGYALKLQHSQTRGDSLLDASLATL